MAITPHTDIRLLNVPFELDNKNQLTFNNIEEQTEYFQNLKFIEAENCTYQRKDSTIRFPMHIDKILNYNYVMYKNNNYSNKWFYAFITNMEYLNDNVTLISIKTDVYQTWQFDIVFKPSFVEREHVSDDTIGLHTIDENLNVGDVIQEYQVEEASLSQFYWVAVMSSYNPANSSQFDGISIYNKNIFGNQIHIFQANDSGILRNLLIYLMKCNADGHINDVKDIFIIPDALIDTSKLTTQTFEYVGYSCTFYKLNYSYTAESFNLTLPKRYNFTGFTPKNNKCYCYPYNYMFVSNNNGNQNIFKYEDFNSTDVNFIIELAIGIGCSGKLTPLNYKRKARDNDESLPLGKYPTCGWSADSYTNWLTQNAINQTTEITSKIANTAIGLATNPYVTASTIPTQIAGLIGNYYENSLKPNIESPQNIGDVNFASNVNTFTVHCMRSKNEYLQVIDNFFTMYGYKVNSVKLPNITGRLNWNYVKTINANVLGEIPQQDIEELKNILNDGVTFWHNPNTFLDYSKPNNIV